MIAMLAAARRLLCVRELERAVITRAAQALGLTRQALYRRMEKFRLT